MKTTNKTRTAFLGVIIGDGYIARHGNAGITHCEKQKDYLEWKRKYLIGEGIKCNPVRFKHNGVNDAYLFSIKTTSYSKLFRRILYSKGYKNYYKRKLLNRLEPIHLAIWYMDDGGLSQKKRGGIVYANELMLNTHTTKENNQVLIDYFREVWDINFKQYKNKGWYRLACGTKEARKFIAIVKPYVEQVPSMLHKIAIKDKYKLDSETRRKLESYKVAS